jgi:hypothetical protein
MYFGVAEEADKATDKIIASALIRGVTTNHTWLRDSRPRLTDRLMRAAKSSWH